MKAKLIILCLLVLSCKSVSETSKKSNKYSPLDSVTIAKKRKNYTIKITDNWYTFLDTSHGLISYAPKGISLKENEFPSTYFSIWKTKRVNCNHKKLKETTDCYVKNISRNFKDYKYEIIKTKHLLYGDYYLVKSAIDYNGEVFINVKGFMKNDKTIFETHYSSRANDFDKYLPQVVKMIESFKITKDEN